MESTEWQGKAGKLREEGLVVCCWVVISAEQIPVRGRALKEIAWEILEKTNPKNWFENP
jgi:hypothetical protein